MMQVNKISDNEIYLLIKYIKSVPWRVAKRLSYIENTRCLNFNHPSNMWWRIYKQYSPTSNNCSSNITNYPILPKNLILKIHNLKHGTKMKFKISQKEVNQNHQRINPIIDLFNRNSGMHNYHQ